MNIIKVVVLGESGVGKTSLMNRYIKNSFDEYQWFTMTTNYLTKQIKYKDQEYKLDIWDTAGRQNFRALNKIFLKDVNIIILVYDITIKSSFLELQYWLDLILEKYSGTFLILVGNKNDLSINRKIKKSDGEKFANVIHAVFTEANAKDNNTDWNDFLENTFINYLKIKEGN